jgi:hypothetical protein
MANQTWKQLLKTAPTREFVGRLGRCIPKLTFDGGDPSSYLFTSGKVNRCNPEGVSCIYMGEDKATADCEYESYNANPEPLLTYYGDFSAAAIIDFETQAARAHFGLTDADFFEAFRLKPTPTRLHRLGEAIHEQKRIIAIRYPSNACHAKDKTSYNWAIFLNALGAPDFLKILGRKEAILEEWPNRKAP